MRRVFAAAFPLTRQGMHPLVALEKSTLRRMSLDYFLILPVGFPRSYRHPRTLDTIGLDVVDEFVAKKKEAAGRDLDTTLSSSVFILYPLHRCEKAYQADFFGTAKRAEMADID